MSSDRGARGIDAPRERVLAALGPEVLVADDGRYARDDGAVGPFPPGLVVRPRSQGEVV